MRVYIAGQMRGVPYYNFPAFDAAARRLRELGVEVVSPADLDRARGFDPMTLSYDADWNRVPDRFDLHACILEDVAAILKCQTVALLPGWGRSAGANAEVAIASWAGISVVSVEELVHMLEYVKELQDRRAAE